MSVVTTYSLSVNTTETLDTDVDAATTPTIAHTGFSSKGTIDANSDVPATLASFETVALVASASTIDLTALTGTNGIAVDGTGLKVQVFKITNTGTNAMTISEGASNGYALLGAAFSFILLAGQEVLLFLNESAPDVAGADKTIDVAGTLIETFQLSVVLG
jgi:hypothetical protein